jgi:tetratricopeptide (TPR) repeat protein
MFKSKMLTLCRWGRALCLLLLLAGTALYINPHTYNNFDLPKTVWINFFGLVTVGLTLISLVLGRSFRLSLDHLNIALLVFLAINVLSLVEAQSLPLAKDYIQFLLMIYVIILVLQDYLNGKPRRLMLLAWALVVSALLTAGWVVYQDFMQAFAPGRLAIVSRLQDWRGFLSAGLGNTNYVGDYLAFVFPIALLLYLYARGKAWEVLALGALGIMYAALIVCWSVTSNASVIVACVVVGVLLVQGESLRFWRRKTLRLSALVVGFAVITLFYTTNHPLNPHRPSIFREAFASERWRAGWPTRLVIWANTLEMIRKNPWLGVGAGNFTYRYVQELSPMLLDRPDLMAYAGAYTNAAHNELLQLWAELGVLGVAAMVFIVVLFYKELAERLARSGKIHYLIRISAMGCMSAFVIQSLMNYPLRLPTSSLLFFALLCVPIVLKDKTRQALWRFLLPLELDYGQLKITAYVEKLRVPRELEFRFEPTRWVAYVITGLLAILFTFGAAMSLIPMQSDYHYKRATILLVQGDTADAEKEFQAALSLNPEHSDCRSAYAVFLLNEKRYEEAVRHLLRLQERLVSSEIYLRLGEAYVNLGEKEKAIENWRIYFARRPIAQFEYPQLYEWVSLELDKQRWAKQREANEASTTTATSVRAEPTSAAPPSKPTLSSP